MMKGPILIIKLGALGDVLRTTSLLQGIKEFYPENPVWWVTLKPAKDLLINNNLIERIIVMEENIEEELKKVSFFKIINLDEDETACRLAISFYGEKIGFVLKDGKVAPTPTAVEWFNMSSLGEKPQNDVLKQKNRKTYQQIMLEIVRIKPKRFDIIFNLTKEEKDFGDAFAKQHGIGKDDIVVGINTGAGKRWRLKTLPEEKTAELIDTINKIKDKKIKMLLLGGPEEIERNKRILAMVKCNIIDPGYNNLVRRFAAIVNLCDVVVTSDSLAMHIAIGLKKGIVVFFGPTSSHEIELYGRGVKVTPRGGCICCYKKEPLMSPSCIDMVSVDDLFGAVKRIVLKMDKRSSDKRELSLNKQ